MLKARRRNHIIVMTGIMFKSPLVKNILRVEVCS